MRHEHDFETVQQTADGFKQVCTECKTVIIRSDGDNRAYLKEHPRDTAQPTGATAKIFARYHGKVIQTKRGPVVKK